MSNQSCFCGCDHFKFKPVDPDDFSYMKPCRNCGHNLSEHIVTIRSKQAD